MSILGRAADLDSHHIEGFAVHGDTPFSCPLVSHIHGKLWTGGCEHGVRLPDDFRYVVSLHPLERYALGPDTERIELWLDDAPCDLGAGEAVYETARWALRRAVHRRAEARVRSARRPPTVPAHPAMTTQARKRWRRTT